MSQPAQAIEQCASCHSRREPFLEGNPVPGTPYHDTYNLSLLREGSYDADGQILDEVYVYGSFIQSKMHQAGVACTNCHNPHSNQLVIEGNSVCAQCHLAKALDCSLAAQVSEFLGNCRLRPPFTRRRGLARHHQTRG